MLDRIKELSYLKEYSAKQRKEENERQTKAFIMDVLEVKNRLHSVRSRFNTASDDNLVESLIFEEKALISRYQYMIKLAKLRGIRSNLLLNTDI